MAQGQALPAQPSFGTLQPGARVGCVVSESAEDHAWLSLSASVRGRLHALDADVQPHEAAAFAQHFKVGSGACATACIFSGSGWVGLRHGCMRQPVQADWWRVYMGWGEGGDS